MNLIKKYWRIPSFFACCMMFGFAYYHTNSWYGLGISLFLAGIGIVCLIFAVLWFFGDIIELKP